MDTDKASNGEGPNNVNSMEENEGTGESLKITEPDVEIVREISSKDDKQAEGTTLRSVIRNVKADPVYRHRLIHTAILCWSFVGLGWAVGMSGPTFPDIRLIIDEDLGRSSWVFTTGSFGYLSGSLIGGLLYDKFNKLLLLAMSSLGMGVATMVTPYCSAFPLMLFIKFTGGFFCGGLDTGGNADLLYVWGSQSGSFMQLLHFGFSFGALLSPLATEPFLAKRIQNCENVTTIGSTNIPEINVSESAVSMTKTGLLYKESNLMSNHASELNVSFSDTAVQCSNVYEETRVEYAFLLSSLIILSSTVGFLYVALRLKFSKSTSKFDVKQASMSNRSADKAKRHKMSRGLKVIFLVLLMLLITSYCIIEDCFSSFFMTFSLAHLHWDKASGSLGTAVFWIAFGIGRFIGIFTISCCESTSLFTTHMFLLTVGYVGFFISTFFIYSPLIWVSVALLGFSMSIIFPAIFTWTSDHVIHVSGKISAIFLTSSSLGGMTYPLIVGNLMENFHPMWYVYLLGIVLCFSLTMYICIRILERVLLDGKRRGGQQLPSDIDGNEMELLN